MSDPSRRRPSPRARHRKPIETWSKADYDDHGRLATLGHKYGIRRRKRKARVAAMTTGRRVARRLMILGTYLLGLIAVVMVAVIVAYFQFTNVPRPEDLAEANQQVAVIQYSDGTTLARIGNLDRTIVPLSDVPASTRWAVLAAEDRNFYGNGAVSITGTVRAAAVDVTGGATQGGSGITQQYVKNAYLDSSQTLTRKLKELMIAVKLSREYSKDEILGFYLNTVYFGRGAYGIDAAARAYFGEDVTKLTVAQGALLAAVLRAPSYYDPAVSPTQARQRWDYVVQGMVDTNHLTSAQASALTFPTTKSVTSTGLGAIGWKALVQKQVLAELAAQGITENEIYQRGMAIRTTIDRRAQSAALTAIHTVFADRTAKQRNLKNALVAITPKTGAVVAYYPGSGPGVKGYDGQVDDRDWGQQFANSPGSSFKPIVLATALQQTLDQTEGKIHYAINSVVDGSSPQTIEGTVIRNDPSDGGFSKKQITLSDAMRRSLNTTFDRLAVEVGPDQVAAMAHKLGVAVKDSDGRPTLVDLAGANKGDTTFGIGIGDYPATTLDMAQVYATLADGGLRNDSFMVSQATASDGSIVYKHNVTPERVLDSRIANDVTLPLEKVAGDAGRALSSGRQSAAKTGTEGLSGASTNNSDAWTVGFTPQVSAAVWVGTGAKKPIFNSAGQPMYGRDEPAQIWQQFMDSYLSSTKAAKQSLPTRQLLSTEGQTITAPTFTPPPMTFAPSTNPVTQAPTTALPTETPTVPVQPTQPLPPPTQPVTVPPTRANTCGLLGNGPC